MVKDAYISPLTSNAAINYNVQNYSMKFNKLS